MIALSDLQKDGLIEILNIANGRAAASLSKTINEPITIRVPMLQFVSLPSAVRMLVAAIGEGVCCVSQDFKGPFDARVTLIFPRDKCATVVNLWSGEPLSEEAIADLQDEVLTEVGNIVLYAAFSAIAKALGGKFSGTLPTVSCGPVADVVQAIKVEGGETILLTLIDFGFARQNFQGYLSLFLTQDGIDRLIECVDRFVQGDTSL